MHTDTYIGTFVASFTKKEGVRMIFDKYFGKGEGAAVQPLPRAKITERKCRGALPILIIDLLAGNFSKKRGAAWGKAAPTDRIKRYRINLNLN